MTDIGPNPFDPDDDLPPENTEAPKVLPLMPRAERRRIKALIKKQTQKVKPK